MKKTKYFVSYTFLRPNDTCGFGNIDIDIAEDLPVTMAVVRDIERMVSAKYQVQGVVVLHWQPVQPIQPSPRVVV